jgi:hypothetical protein
MKLTRTISMILGCATAAAIMTAGAPSHACTSPFETAWTLQRICSDGTTQGSSQGFLSPYRLVATLTLGSKAVAQGVRNSGLLDCSVQDTSTGGGGVSVGCTTAAIKHRVVVTP